MRSAAVALILGGVVVGCMPLLYLSWAEPAYNSAVAHMANGTQNEAEFHGKTRGTAKPDHSLRFEYQIAAGLMVLTGVGLAVRDPRRGPRSRTAPPRGG